MIEAVTVPKLGLTMKNATVVKWHKREGDVVKKDEVIAEIETDKVTCQIQSPQDGMLLKVQAQKGAKILVGGVPRVSRSAGRKSSRERKYRPIRRSLLPQWLAVLRKCNLRSKTRQLKRSEYLRGRSDS